MHIVLYAPEIPQNTGNIARTCAATGSVLHLIEPLGFELSDKYLKRAGLDYWHLMELHVHPDFDTMMAEYPHAVYHFATTKAPRGYHEASYGPEDFLVFGCETKGLPESLLSRVYDRCIRIPMQRGAVAEPEQLCGHCALRGAAPAGLPQPVRSRRADRAAG